MNRRNALTCMLRLVNAAKASSNLDLLRSCAVLLVVVAHVIGVWRPDDLPGYHMQALGLLGVEFFFVHTSLVLMFSLQRLSASAPAHQLTTFLVRRFFRIYPLSVVVVARSATRCW